MKLYENVAVVSAVAWDGSPASTLEVCGLWLYGPDVKMEPDDYSPFAVEALEKILFKMGVKEGDYLAKDSSGRLDWVKKEMFERVYTERQGDVILS